MGNVCVKTYRASRLYRPNCLLEADQISHNSQDDFADATGVAAVVDDDDYADGDGHIQNNNYSTVITFNNRRSEVSTQTNVTVIDVSTLADETKSGSDVSNIRDFIRGRDASLAVCEPPLADVTRTESVQRNAASVAHTDAAAPFNESVTFADVYTVNDVTVCENCTSTDVIECCEKTTSTDVIESCETSTSTDVTEFCEASTNVDCYGVCQCQVKVADSDDAQQSHFVIENDVEDDAEPFSDEDSSLLQPGTPWRQSPDTRNDTASASPTVIHQADVVNISTFAAPGNTQHGQEMADTMRAETTVHIENVGTVYIQNICLQNCPNIDDSAQPLIAKLSWETSSERERADALEKAKEDSENRCKRLVAKMQKQRRRSIQQLLQQAQHFAANLQTGATETEDQQRLLYEEFQAKRRELERRGAERLCSLACALAEERTRGEQSLAHLQLQHERDRLEERSKVMTFVVALENNQRQRLDGIDSEQLQDVARRLSEDFDVRLLGVDCGLTFLLESSTEQWLDLLKRKQEMQRVLCGLLPGDVAMQSMDRCWLDSDVDLHQQRAFPDSVAFAVQGRAPSFDPMHATPVDHFRVLPDLEGDRARPWVTSLVLDLTLTRIFMLDYCNSCMKVTSVDPPHHVTRLPFNFTPLSMALMKTRKLAVTTFNNNVILLVDITGTPHLLREIPTSKFYRGVAAMDDDVTLVVSCCDVVEGSSSIDVITLEGQLLKTVTEELSLCSPNYLCLHDGAVIISDRDSNAIYVVDMDTGRCLHTLEHPRLRSPCQVVTDRAGNLYIANEGSQCVLVKALPAGQGQPTGGHRACEKDGGREKKGAGKRETAREEDWKVLLNSKQHGEGKCVCPRALALTNTGLVVSWDEMVFDSVLKGFCLTA